MLELIKRLCAEKRITIFRLERDLGFGNGTIRGWGTACPQSDKLKRVADYFGVTVDELLKEEAHHEKAEAAQNLDL